MGAAKKKRDAAALAKAAATADLGPLTDAEVRTAVLAHIVRTGKVRRGPRRPRHVQADGIEVALRVVQVSDRQRRRRPAILEAMSPACGHRPRENLLIGIIETASGWIGLYGNLVAELLPCGHFCSWRKI